MERALPILLMTRAAKIRERKVVRERAFVSSVRVQVSRVEDREAAMMEGAMMNSKNEEQTHAHCEHLSLSLSHRC